MTQFKPFLTACTLAMSLFTPLASQAGETTGLERAALLPGWRLADGSHMAAVQIVLEPGWKTYWRAPGDVGIPPQFDWTGSRNIGAVSANWPSPEVFFEQGARSVGYTRSVVIPLHLTARDDAADIQLSGEMQIGLCKDICIPANLSFTATLPPASARPDPVIAAALADMPYTAGDAGVRSVTCRFEVSAKGGLILHSAIDMPATGGTEHVVVEAGNPHLWVAEPDSRRDGGTLHASTRLVHVEGRSFAVDRSDLRFTIIGASRAVDIQGCTP
ncbi:protein-disulfide reductase DsbD domain-containing protein [Marivita sp.]|uniref:protein-disulfide reductase DsbD domain-containing protein n=1 Tax=Marivita sp. TaxID=2003365 RepID=UPI0025C2C67C|nr:protein-disulfide reductase DsbD domain-containing protein [Marivita sp.]